MPVVTVETNEDLLREYQAAGEIPVIFYFYSDGNLLCDDTNGLFNQIANEYSQVTTVCVNYLCENILEGTDFTVSSTPTVIVGINGIESCEDKLVEWQITEESIQNLFQKYSS